MRIIEYKDKHLPHILIFFYSIFSKVKRFVAKHPLLIFIFIGLLVYGSSLSNGFVWDDEEQLLNNGLVHSLGNIGQLLSNSTFSLGGAAKLGGVYYRPVMMVYFALLYSFFGPSGFVFHLVQVLLHILSVWLLYKIISKLANKSVGLITAVLFLVHPIAIEAVSYVSAVQDVLVAFFGLLSLWILISRKNILLTTFFLFIAFLAKENAVVFVFIELAYLTLFCKGLALTAAGMTNKERQDNLVSKYLIYVVLAISVYALLRFGVANVHFVKFDLAPIVQLEFWQRLLNIPALFIHYLTITFWPQTLAIAQHWVVKNFTFVTFGIPLILSAVCCLLLLFGAIRIGKVFAFFSIWFIVALGMYMQLFPFDFTVSERWYYIGLMGLISLISLTLDHFKLLKKPVVIGILLIIISLLAYRSITRTMDWKDEITLFSHDIQISQNSFDLTNNYGVALFRRGRYDEAAHYFQRSIQLAPTWTINNSNLGAVYQRKKQYLQAKKYYLLSMKNGDYYLAYENYAGILLAEKKYSAAKKFLEEQALLKFPYNENLRRMEEYLVNQSNK